MLAQPSRVTAIDVNVDVGDRFTFIVNAYSISVKEGAETKSADQFTINGKSPTSPGADAKFTVEILNISTGFFGDTITYQVQLGDETANASSTRLSALFLLLIGYLPTFYLYLITSDYTFSIADIDTDIDGFLPYVIPVNGSNDSLWDSLVESFKNETTTRQDDNSDLTTEIKNSRKNGNFEGYMRFEGTAKNQTTNEELTFNSKVRIVYEMDTGVLQGFKTESTIEGTVDDTEISLTSNVEIIREGYQIEGFGGSGLFGLGIPGFEIGIVVIGLLSSVPIIVKQKKRK